MSEIIQMAQNALKGKKWKVYRKINDEIGAKYLGFTSFKVESEADLLNIYEKNKQIQARQYCAKLDIEVPEVYGIAIVPCSPRGYGRGFRYFLIMKHINANKPRNYFDYKGIGNVHHPKFHKSLDFFLKENGISHGDITTNWHNYFFDKNRKLCIIDWADASFEVRSDP